MFSIYFYPDYLLLVHKISFITKKTKTRKKKKKNEIALFDHVTLRDYINQFTFFFFDVFDILL